MEEEKKEVMVPLKEYRKEIRRTERLKVKLSAMAEEKEKFRGWWLEEEDKNTELRKNLEDAKQQIKELLNIAEEENADEQSE